MTAQRPKKRSGARFDAFVEHAKDGATTMLNGDRIIINLAGHRLEMDLVDHRDRPGCVSLKADGILVLTGHSNRVFIQVESFPTGKRTRG